MAAQAQATLDDFKRTLTLQWLEKNVSPQGYYNFEVKEYPPFSGMLDTVASIWNEAGLEVMRVYPQSFNNRHYLCIACKLNYRPTARDKLRVIWYERIASELPL